MAEFKANVIEEFIIEHDISDVIEFGCGDGNQLSMIEVPSYIGLDTSPTAIQRCKNKFESDDSKSFYLFDAMAFVDNHHLFQAELGLSLDVIYHLTEDDVFHNYMNQLFASSERFVMIYSADTTENYVDAEHVKHRKFTEWVAKYATEWELIKVIENEYPYDPTNPRHTSWSDFYIYEKN